MSENARPSLCACGHPFEGNHRTPGTECSTLGCKCGRFTASPSLCDHVNVKRVRPLYYDGRPLHECLDCGLRFIYAHADSSTKALVPVGRRDDSA